MNPSRQSHKVSYRRQKDHLSTLNLSTHGDFLRYEKTVDAYRHQRMMAPFSSFVAFASWKWLTIGDAHGWDAARLGRMGATDVTASDLSDERLEHAKNEGLIKACLAENAESLSMGDGSYDIVFCKEALHHLPRPWVGLYEMLRVASKAVLLIEPRDWIIDKGRERPSGPRAFAKGLLTWAMMRAGRLPGSVPLSSRLLLGDKPRYETVGNYMFPISSREIEKIALGLDLPAVAFLPLNDHFEKGLSCHQANETDATFRNFEKTLQDADRLSEAGVGSSSMLLVAIFIEMPCAKLEAKLADGGWFMKKLDRNPYLR